jgi:hypothetical protein
LKLSTAIQFWNKQRDAPRTPSTLTPWVLEAKHQLWRGGAPHCWASDFFAFFEPFPGPYLRERFRRGLSRLNEGYLLTAQRAAFHQTFWTRQDPDHPDEPRDLGGFSGRGEPAPLFCDCLHWFWPFDSLRARQDGLSLPLIQPPLRWI